MVQQLRRKHDALAVPVTIGDMATTLLSDRFDLVYVVANSIMNLTTQEEQIAVFSNAAAHLAFGGRFVIELIVPQLRRVPPSEVAWVFRLDSDHVGIETFDDVVGQVAWSHHWIEVDGRLVRHSAPYRYIWPSELLLMAKLTGFELQDRWGDWDRRSSLLKVRSRSRSLSRRDKRAGGSPIEHSGQERRLLPCAGRRPAGYDPAPRRRLGGHPGRPPCARFHAHGPGLPA